MGVVKTHRCVIFFGRFYFMDLNQTEDDKIGR